jgi:radical SAM protein with 4Fe4S-binding SPASM domain
MGLRNWASVAKSLAGRAPTYLILQITSKCNSRCLTCFNWKRIGSPEHNDLSLDEIEKISINYGPLLQLTLGGGEPFLREDIADICLLFNKNNSVQHITIATNCIQSDDIKKATEKILSQCNLNYLRIGISLDGIGEEHDRLRGVEGNYEKVLTTYHYLTKIRKKHTNFGIEISSVLSALNKDTIQTTIDMVKHSFPEIDKHAIVLVRGNTQDQSVKNVDLETYQRTIQYLKQSRTPQANNFIARVFRTVFEINTEIIAKQLKTGELDITCVGGQRLIVITPDGQVYPCEALEASMGSLRECDYSIHAILTSEKARKIKKFIKEKGCSCTFECAIHASLIFNWKHYPRVFHRIFFKV